LARPAKIRRKDLLQPDEFLTLSRRAAAWATANRTTVIAAASAAAVLLIAIVGYNLVAMSRESSAAQGYAAAQSLLADRKYAEAATAFKDVASRYPGTGHGVLAELQAGNALLLADRPAEAALAYERFLKRSPPADYLRQLALTRLAYSAERRDNPTEARTLYASAASEAGIFAEDALLGEARVAEQSGDTAKARELYERFLEAYPASDRRSIVTARLLRLGWVPPSASGEAENADS
jgi:outer membrane protein assembly factor BamD (BamD/ComL family)